MRDFVPARSSSMRTRAAGFTSTWVHWRYADDDHRLPNARRIMAGLCDLRIPLALTQADCEFIVATIEASLAASRRG